MLVVLLSQVTAAIAIVGFSPARVLHFTHRLICLCIVLSCILCNPWSRDITTVLVDTAPTKVPGTPAVCILKWSSLILAVGHVLSGKQSSINGVQAAALAGIVVTVRGELQPKALGMVRMPFIFWTGG